MSGIYDIYTKLRCQNICHGDNQLREDYRLAPKLTKVIHLNIVLLICFNLVKIYFFRFSSIGFWILNQASSLLMLHLFMKVEEECAQSLLF